ncbi:MAG: GMC family oxidoreductase [Acidimicrobiales bacterium]|jgi:gluconate 2-dehydrogenase alpha chain
MTKRALVVGSGPGGSVAAMVLARAGFDVTVFEKGANYFTDLSADLPGTVFSNDELKMDRSFSLADPSAEPRVFRSSPQASPITGAVESLPQTVGGGTVHWDAKTPRYWDIDFKKLSMLGPVPQAEITDWPFDYGEISPYYEQIEELIGVAGDIGLFPTEPTLVHAPRKTPLPMLPGPPEYSSLVVSEGCRKVGLHPFLAPMAINSREYHGRPRCNNCGFCSGYGCPILARIGALAPLREALRSGAELRANSMVVRIETNGRKVTGLSWLDDHNVRHSESAEVVVLAANAIETSRLAQLSDLPDPYDLAGRRVMFHWFSEGSGIFLGERLHNYRGRDHTHDIDDFADPDFPGAREAAKKAGLPYFRAGKVELGGTQLPLDEARSYQEVLRLLVPQKPFGRDFKQLMRSSLLRDRLCGVELIGEDLPYSANRVDLDPTVRDWRGLPVARITYGPGQSELAAQAFYLPWLIKLLKAAGAHVAVSIAEIPSTRFPIAQDQVPATEHVMGGMPMGADPRTSVTDELGRHHHLDNLFVADGSVFPTSGGHNPTLTIMATALRQVTRWAGTA